MPTNQCHAFSSLCSRDINDLIGQEHFGPYIRNQNFSKYEFWSSIQQLIQTFILGQIEKKKLNFPIHSKNPRLDLFSPFLRVKTFFSKNPSQSCITPYEPLTRC